MSSTIFYVFPQARNVRVVTSMAADAAHHRTPAATVYTSRDQSEHFIYPIDQSQARETVTVLRTEAPMTVTLAARGTWCVGATTA